MKRAAPGQFATFFAFDSSTGLPRGDVGPTLTAYVEKDDSQSPVALASQDARLSPHQVGYYDFELTAQETDANKLFFSAESTDVGVTVVGVPPVIYTVSSTISVPAYSGPSLTIGTYQSVAQLDAYALTKLNTDEWDESTPGKKLKASYEATRRIDSLNFYGRKTDPLQLLEFPRDPDLYAPNDILIAHAEIAIELIAGGLVDVRSSLGIASERFAAVGITYDRNSIPIWIRAGVPSELAWNYLVKYLRPISGVRLTRIS